MALLRALVSELALRSTNQHIDTLVETVENCGRQPVAFLDEFGEPIFGSSFSLCWVLVPPNILIRHIIYVSCVQGKSQLGHRSTGSWLDSSSPDGSRSGPECPPCEAHGSPGGWTDQPWSRWAETAFPFLLAEDVLLIIFPNRDLLSSLWHGGVRCCLGLGLDHLGLRDFHLRSSIHGNYGSPVSSARSTLRWLSFVDWQICSCFNLWVKKGMAAFRWDLEAFGKPCVIWAPGIYWTHEVWALRWTAHELFENTLSILIVNMIIVLGLFMVVKGMWFRLVFMLDWLWIMPCFLG